MTEQSCRAAWDMSEGPGPSLGLDTQDSGRGERTE